jgi:ribokinase
MSVVVLGSANLDLVYEVERIPTPGETVLSRGFASFPGGKGNNQAIAAARAGADVQFIVALGRDDAGDRLARDARDAGISLLDRRVDAPTGTAVIYVDRKGENSIVVNSGANAELTELTDTELGAISDADVLVLQLETPLVTVEAAIRAARAASTTVVLNAAPSAAVPAHLLADVDILVVNQYEAAELAGEPAGTGERSLLSVLTAHTCDVIITLGAEGALVGSRGTTPVRIPAYRVEAKDTTGAGDAFVGAFAASLDHTADERSLVEATKFATAAAAISVQRQGAVPSMPSLEEVRRLRAAQ